MLSHRVNLRPAFFFQDDLCRPLALLDEARLFGRDLIALLFDFRVGHVHANLRVHSLTNHVAPGGERSKNVEKKIAKCLDGSWSQGVPGPRQCRLIFGT